MDYDHPTRYDLTDNSTEQPAPPTMESNPRGDYVEWCEYEALLDAYNDRMDKLATIHDLSR